MWLGGLSSVCYSSLCPSFSSWGFVEDTGVPWRISTLYILWQGFFSRPLGHEPHSSDTLKQSIRHGERDHRALLVSWGFGAQLQWEKGHLEGNRGTTAALRWVDMFVDTPETYRDSKKHFSGPGGPWPTEKWIISANVTLVAPTGCEGRGKISLPARIVLCHLSFWTFLQLALWLACRNIWNSSKKMLRKQYYVE